MSDNASTASKNASSLTRPRVFEAILYGGLVVGVLDGLDAVIFFGLLVACFLTWRSRC